jgi:tRNA U34 5-methylaminomethyl-2-thiouridine-forming methyltransferase MnmC
MSIQMTSDGSHTIHSDRFDSSYHSSHGAIQESEHVFINAGLNYLLEKLPNRIDILEIGFGTGLNAFLTLIEAKNKSVDIHYTGVELYPLDLEIIKTLNYPDQLNTSELKNTFLELHSYPNTCHKISLSENKYFEINLRIEDLEKIDFNHQYNLVYLDAFAPSSQPYFWEKEFLQKVYDAMSKDSILVSYCAKGSFKRNLKDIGFIVESIPGPKGKREMTRACKLEK